MKLLSYLSILLLAGSITCAFATTELLIPSTNPDKRVIYEHNVIGHTTAVHIQLVSKNKCSGNYYCFHGYKTTDWLNYSNDQTYRGCGRHASNHFMQWYNKYPVMQNVRHYVPGTEMPAWGTNPIFTTPAQLSVGLENLLKAYQPSHYSMKEINTIRHNNGSKETLIEQFTHHLKRGTPVVTLINNGDHWVTVIGIKYKKSSTGTYSNVQLFYVNNSFSNNAPDNYAELKIRNWDYSDATLRYFVNVMGYTSYQPGTLVSLKTDQIVYDDTWTRGWAGEVFTIKQSNGKKKPFFILFKDSTGTVNVREVDYYGRVGKLVDQRKWSHGWTQMKPFTIGSNTYLFLYKYYSGNVHIHKMNKNGTIGSEVERDTWTEKWQNINFFENQGKTYLLINKTNGLTHLHLMNSDGSVGPRLMTTSNGFMKDVTDIAVMSDPNSKRVHFYGVSSQTGTFYHFYHTLQSNRNFTRLEKQSWSTNWTQISTFSSSYNNKCLLIAKGSHEIVPVYPSATRNGLVHVHKLKQFNQNAMLGKMVDTNYFTNKKVLLTPEKGWTKMEYFKAPNGKLNLFMLDKYSGNVRIVEMNNDCSFKGKSVLYKTLH